MKDQHKSKKQLIDESVESHSQEAKKDLNKKISDSEYQQIWHTYSQSPIPTLILSKKGKIFEYNSAMRKLTGYSHKEVSDIKAWMPKIYPDEEYRNKVIEISRKSRNREIEVKRNVFTITRKDGEKRIIQFSVYDILTEGKPTDLQIVQGEDITKRLKAEEELRKHRDHLEKIVKERTIELSNTIEDLKLEITERKKAEEALRDSEERYRAIFEQAADSVVLVDAKTGELVEFNDRAHENLGYTRKEFEKLKIPDFEVMESPEEVTQHIEKIIKERSDAFDTKHRTKGGEIRDILVNSKAISIRGKDFAQSIWRDITERKKMEEKLRESEERYRSFAQNFRGISFRTGLDFTPTFFHGTVGEMTGYTEEEFDTGKVKWPQIIHPDDTPMANELWKKLTSIAGYSDEAEYRIIRKDGKVSWVFSSFQNICDDSGKIRYIQGAVYDVTERKRAEEEKERLQAQLIQSVKMAGIGTLTSGIAHEFNNLLQIMRGHTEFAYRTKKADDMEQALGIVVNTSDRVAKIIQDLLTFSRKEVPEKELCDITEPIESVLSMTEEQLIKHNIVVERRYGRVPKIRVNKSEMQQVFLNLVTNARDAILPKAGRLEIEVKQVKGNVEVSFTDRGKGIERENLGKVFEPFYTTKGAIGGDGRIQGVGLGLSVSYGIVQSHGGTIEVDSEVGNGTTFTVKIPIKREEAEGGITKIEEKKKGGKPKPRNILVVDDEEEICNMFMKWLSDEGHKVKSAFTGKKAINLAKKEDFDIVFLDIVMPGIRAIDVVEQIKKISPEIKVIMTTGRLLDEDSWKELRQKGATGYLQKPFKI